MNKFIIYLILSLFIVSCKRETKQIDIASELRGNTYNIIVKSEKDTLVIFFKDSTYTVYRFSDRNLPWRISNFDDSNFLALEDRIMALKPNGTDKYKGLIIGERDIEVELVKRESIWQKELLNGIWIEEENLPYFTDSIQSNLPPPPPPAPIDEGKSFQWPRTFEIMADTIICKDFYSTSKSVLKTNNSNEFLEMKLKSSDSTIENLWRIKSFYGDLMIIERTLKTQKRSGSSSRTTIENVRLIKKR
jgi:hypothetical protein